MLNVELLHFAMIFQISHMFQPHESNYCLCITICLTSGPWNYCKFVRLGTILHLSMRLMNSWLMVFRLLLVLLVFFRLYLCHGSQLPIVRLSSLRNIGLGIKANIKNVRGFWSIKFLRYLSGTHVWLSLINVRFEPS